uniref:Secreted protein n=1 Tax=Rhipicephalus appendiculatus TaxID=34631 RepID=A0A131YJ20_RHIAP
MARATILCCVLPFTITYAFSDWCNATYNERLERAIAGALNGIQEVHVSEMEVEGPGPGPLGFDGYRVIGLGRLQRHGDLRTLCENETQAVSFDLLAQEPVVCSFLKTGGGNNTLELAAHDVKVTTYLRFIAGPPDDNDVAADRRVLDQYEEPLVTTLRTGRVTVNIDDTSGDAVNATLGLLRHLALAAIQDSWEELFVSKFVRILKYR